MCCSKLDRLFHLEKKGEAQHMNLSIYTLQSTEKDKLFSKAPWYNVFFLNGTKEKARFDKMFKFLS